MINVSKIKKAETEYLLNRAGVDHVADALTEWMQNTGMKRPDRIRMRLTMETLLLNVCEHFDGKAEGTLLIGKRFGRPYFRFRYQGEPYDPRAEDDSLAEEPDRELRGDDVWTRQLLTSMGVAPTWRYHSGINEIALQAPRGAMRQETWLIIAVIGALLLGFSGTAFPDGLRSGLSEYLMTPLADMFMHLLNTFAGLLVFLSVLCGICGVGNAAEFSKKGKYVMSRYLYSTVILAGVMGLAALPFYRFGNAGGEGESQFSAIFDMITGIIPTNSVTPFAEGNMMQIVFMAILLGVVLLSIGERVDGLRDGLMQVNAVVMRVVEIICQLLPIYIFTSLTAMMWNNGLDVFVELWKPLVLGTALSAAAVFVSALLTGVKFKMSPFKLLGKVKSAGLIALMTASSMAAFGTVMETNEKNLGIDPTLSRFTVPIGNLLNCATQTMVLMLVTIHLTSFYGLSIGIAWFFTLWLMSTILSLALPPVSGAVLVCLGLVLSQFNIPGEALSIAGTLAILLDFPTTGARVALQQLQTTRMADHLGMIDKEILQK